MTRVFKSPNHAKGFRALIVGCGHYPNASVAQNNRPALTSLSSAPLSVMAFAQRLLTSWRDTLALNLLSVDLLLSDPKTPNGAVWPGFGVPGEIAAGSPIDAPTFDSIGQALTDALDGAGVEEGLILYFCGHGFSKNDRFFVPSDFGRVVGNPWHEVVNLDELDQGLQQEKPRRLMLFWDCCADVPAQILDALGSVGSSPIQPMASALSSAKANYGPSFRFGASASVLAGQAFGAIDKPTRFAEVLIEALDGAGARKRYNGDWWVDHLGVQDALQTYAKRHPELDNPDFFVFASPFFSDSSEIIRIRKLNQAPSSHLLVSSAPNRGALKRAPVSILPEGVVDDAQALPGLGPAIPKTALVCFKVPPQRAYTVKANFATGPQTLVCFADLPLAEPAEFLAP